MKTTPKDFFLHLASTVVLYVSAISLLQLVFTSINYALPDKLGNYFYASSIVWPISVLIVLTPLLYVLEYFIGRDARLMPEKRQIWIRRWRIYLTLFLTGATIAGDLIALINTFLNGEISSRFIWKVVSVLLVCALIFAYFILEKMSDETNKNKTTMKVLAGLGIVFVLIGIVAGFVIVGSPAKQRAIKFDNQRINDLSSLQYQITYYWQRNEKLPANLAALTDSISGYSAPIDPDTKSLYEYNPKGGMAFELCANFTLPYNAASNMGRGDVMSYPYPAGAEQSNWNHPAGHSCFERTIDPTIYPPQKNLPKPIPL
jgi:hypothetical protein